jgi:hypothetical protein
METPSKRIWTQPNHNIFPQRNMSVSSVDSLRSALSSSQSGGRVMCRTHHASICVDEFSVVPHTRNPPIQGVPRSLSSLKDTLGSIPDCCMLPSSPEHVDLNWTLIQNTKEATEPLLHGPSSLTSPYHCKGPSYVPQGSTFPLPAGQDNTTLKICPSRSCPCISTLTRMPGWVLPSGGS